MSVILHNMKQAEDRVKISLFPAVTSTLVATVVLIVALAFCMYLING